MYRVVVSVDAISLIEPFNFSKDLISPEPTYVLIFLKK